MNSVNPDASVNWEQVRDLVGYETDESQQELLADMWKDMKADVRADWARLEGPMNEKELKEALHRMRGVVSMWGLSEVAGVMHAIEKGPEPTTAWLSRSAELSALCDRGMKAIVTQFPWLESGSA